MVVMENQSHWWWFEGHNNHGVSPWLQSTLTELDEKTKAMLKVIEEDADSFAQRAEMYYKKRPELINMVEDFYRSHRSLAERFDLIKQDTGGPCSRILLPKSVSPFSVTKHTPKKAADTTNNMVYQSYDSYSETFDSGESSESEVDDPEQEFEIKVYDEEEMEENEVMKMREEIEKLKEENQMQKENELMKLKEEVEKLKKENKIQKVELLQKDQDKREVIKQLSLAVEILKDENVNLKKKLVARDFPQKNNPNEFNKLKSIFFSKWFGN